MSLERRWSDSLQELRSFGCHRTLQFSSGIDLTSNDYLAYAGSRACLPPTCKPESLPTSGTASRLLRGHHPVWEEVEERLAAWHGAESALMMSTGYAANEGLLSTIVDLGDWVASDEHNHASIVDGLRLNRPQRFIFRHNDLNHLEEGLRRQAKAAPLGERFIVTESLFSMDGDRAPLDELVTLAGRFGAHVIVDEAHATGCLGPRGEGLVNGAGLRPNVLATIHTGGKAMGVTGAYICGSRQLREYLVNHCRQLIYSTALAPAIGHWWLQAIERVQSDDAGRLALRQGTLAFRQDLARLDVVSLGTDHIVPILVGEDNQTVQVAERLQAKGYDIRPIRSPTVPTGKARLRISIHADHDSEMLARLAADLRDALKS